MPGPRAFHISPGLVRSDMTASVFSDDATVPAPVATVKPTLIVVRGLAPQARCRPNGTIMRPGGVSGCRQNAAAGSPIAIEAAAAAAPARTVRRRTRRACCSAMLSRAASRSGRPSPMS